MYRLHFTAEDLARIRLVPSHGPYAEAIFSLGRLADGRRVEAMFGGWRQKLCRVPNSWARPLYQLMGREPMLDLFTLMGRVSSATACTEALLAVGRRQLGAEVEAAARWAAATAGRPGALPNWAFRLPHDTEIRTTLSAMLRACITATIDPHWTSIQAHLDVEVTIASRLLARGGVGHLLDGLHPSMRWQDGSLIVHEPGHGTTGVISTIFRDGTSGVTVGPSDIHLDGRGLLLVPSVFCRRTTPYVGVAGSDGPVVLFYPALREVVDAHRLWARCYPGSTQALRALLGSTRAEALEALSDTCTTTELASRLRVSLPTASHHATILREAGLITTRRHGGAVLHAISPLGVALLNGGTLQR